MRPYDRHAHCEAHAIVAASVICRGPGLGNNRPWASVHTLNSSQSGDRRVCGRHGVGAGGGGHLEKLQSPLHNDVQNMDSGNR